MWYPGYTELTNMANVIAPDNMVLFLSEVRNQFEEHNRCEIAQRKLVRLPFCKPCKRLLNEVPSVEELLSEYEIHVGCLCVEVLEFCAKCQYIIYRWFFEDVLDEPEDRQIPFGLVLLELERIHLMRTVNHIRKQRGEKILRHFDTNNSADTDDLCSIAWDIDTLSIQEQAIDARVNRWVKENPDGNWSWWFEYEE